MTGVYGKWLDADLKRYFEIEVFRIPYRQPWKNGRIERLFKSLKTEIFHRVDVADCSHARRLCHAWQEYYNTFRPHQSKGGRSPCDSANSNVPSEVSIGSICKVKVADGLITRYELAA